MNNLSTPASFLLSIEQNATRQELRFDQQELSIGRVAENDLVFEHEAEMSSRHLQLSIKNGKALAHDLGAKNGVFINGQRLNGHTEVSEHDEIRVGPNGPRLWCKIIDADSSTLLAAGPNLRIGQAKTPSTGDTPEQTKSRVGYVLVALLIGIICVSFLVWKISELDAQLQAEQSRQEKQLAETNQPHFKQTYDLPKVLSIPDTKAEPLKVAEVPNMSAEEIKVLFEKIDAQEKLLAALQNQQASDAQKQQRLIAEAEAQLRNLATAMADKAALPQVNAQRWADMYAEFKQSLFLVVSFNPQTGTVGLGTAFAIDNQGMLATNAHVVQFLRSMPQRMLIQNETGKVYRIKRAAHNPLFITLSSPDIGIIEMDLQDELVTWKSLPLAEDASLHQLQVGSELGTIGFPGELQKQYIGKIADSQDGLLDLNQVFKGAVATFKHGWLGRISNYQGETASAAENVVIQHSASLSGGTSGSPIFNIEGKVFAIASSSMTSSFQVGSLRTHELLSAAQIAFAVRVDELRAFMKQAKLQTLP